MTDPKPHVVLCNGVTCPKPDVSAPDCLRLSYREGDGSPANMNLALPDFVSDVVHLPDRVLDLLEIAAYVYCADRSVRRGEKDALEYHAWSRYFHFFIRVRDHVFWERPEVGQLLDNLLRFLAGDHQYRFTFQSGHTTPKAHLFDEAQFTLEAGAQSEVVLFSGGLDSLTGVVEQLTTTNNHLYLVSHRSQTMSSRTQEQLLAALRERHPGRVDHYKFQCNRKVVDARRAKEETQRTRFFLYTSIAYALAHALDKNAIHVYENGMVSLNIAKQESTKEARASRTTHPKTIHLLQKFFSLVKEAPFTIHTPYFWMTKTDVVARLNTCGGKTLYSGSVSCSKTFKLEAAHTHCGTCSQCVDRRFAAYAAGLGDVDDLVPYSLDIIRKELVEGEHKTTVVDFVRQADTFSKCGSDQFHNDYLNELLEVVDYIGIADEMEAVQRVWELCQRHGRQVKLALKDIQHIYDDHGCNPPVGSLLNILNTREYLKEPVIRLVETIERRLRRALPVAFRKSPPNDENDLNDKISAYLQGDHEELEREHPSITFALAHTVPDHASVKHNLLIETKYLRGATTPSKITDALAADLKKYTGDAYRLFVIYDPKRAISDDDKFSADFEQHERCKICIIR
jgi:7-cyano-7-deazaguanine synthase in queuosine biosynthesis